MIVLVIICFSSLSLEPSHPAYTIAFKMGIIPANNAHYVLESYIASGLVIENL